MSRRKETPQSSPNPVPANEALCAYHPEIQAGWVCDSCGRFYCDDCVVRRNVGKFRAHVCPVQECRGRCRRIEIDHASGSVSVIREAPVDPRRRRFGSKRGKYPVWFYASMALPSLAMIAHYAFAYIQGYSPWLWMLPLFAGLVFIMSARVFWAYVITSVITFAYGLNALGHLLSKGRFPKDDPLLVKIELGIFIIAFITLAVSWSEYPD